jgi:hypothetical protein
MIIVYLLCAAVMCVVGYALVWICTGIVMSLFSKKFQVEDEDDDSMNNNDNS